MDSASEKMFLFNRTLHPATTVDRCVAATFTGPFDRNLILSKSNVLEIYSLTQEPNRALTLRYQRQLDGLIEDILPVRFPQYDTDCLLIAFAEAKVSLICFDPNSNDIHTVSLHYFEEGHIQEEKVRCPNSAAELRIDPSLKCCVLLVYRRWLFVMPFTQDDSVLWESDPFKLASDKTGGSGPTRSAVELSNERLPIGDHAIVDLQALGFANVRDFCFLYGFAEPTIAVLHEQEPTWAGRLQTKSLTCCATAFALSGVGKKEPLTHPVIMRAQQLPYDCFGLLALEAPLGGVLVLAANSVVHATQTKITAAYLNEYGKEELNSAAYQSRPGVSESGPVCMEIGGCARISLEPTKIMLGLKTGQLLLIRLMEQSGLVNDFRFISCEAQVITSCVCTLSDDLIFLGSRVGNSWLAYANTAASSDRTPADDLPIGASDFLMDLDTFYDTAATSTNATSSEPITPEPDGCGDMANLFDLFSEGKDKSKKAKSTSSFGKFVVRKIDCVYNVGPIVDTAFGESMGSGEDDKNPRVALAKRMARSYHEKLQTMDLVTCSGSGVDGAIHILQRAVRPFTITAHGMEGIKGLWSIRVRRLASLISRKRKRDTEDGDAAVPAPAAPDASGERGEGEVPPAEKTEASASTDAAAATSETTPSATTEVKPDPTPEVEPPEEVDGDDVILEYDTHLVISRPIQGSKQSTMVWQAKGGKLEEVDAAAIGIETRGLTLNVKCIYDGKLTIQVLQRFFVILRGTKRMCNVFFVDTEQDPPQLFAHHSEVFGSHLLVLTGAGTLMFYTFHSLEEQERHIQEALAKGETKPNILSFVELGRKPQLSKNLGRVTAFTVFTPGNNCNSMFTVDGNQVESFCLVWWSCGALEVYTLPDFRSVFLCSDAFEQPAVIRHFDRRSGNTAAGEQDIRGLYHHVYATEMLMQTISVEDTLAYLLIRLNTGELCIYAPFSAPATASTSKAASTSSSLLPVRFSKFRHEYMGRDHDLPLPPLRSKEDETFWLERMQSSGLKPKERNLLINSPLRRQFIPFEDISTYKGVFIAGENPSWVFSYKGHLVLHRMANDGPVDCLTPFHIPQCSKGFVQFASVKNSLSIAQLQPSDKGHWSNLTTLWPMQRIPLLQTPHNIMFHPVQRTYTVITSIPEPYKPQLNELMNPEDPESQAFLANMVAKYESRAVPKALQDRFSVNLFSADTWTLMDKITLEPNETVVAAKTVQLSKEDRSVQYGNDDDELNLRLRKSKETTNLQCVGSGLIAEEDLPCRGRILLMDVTPNISSRKGDRKLLTLFHEGSKGPVSAITSLEGYLVVAVSSKIMMYFYDWTVRKCIIAAFFDAQYYVTSLTSVKSFLAYGDVYKSVYFLRWREETRQLMFLGRDFNRDETMSTAFVYIGNQLCLLSADANKNFSIFSYRPEMAETSHGLVLLPMADINIGAHVTGFLPLRASKPNPNNKYHNLPADKTVLVYGTLDGSIGYIFAVDENRYRRLFHLLAKMYTEIPHPCGLHPKAFRMYKGERKQRFAHIKYRSPNVIDGDLIEQFGSLDRAAQVHLGQKIGIRAEAIPAILNSLDSEMPFF